MKTSEPGVYCGAQYKAEEEKGSTVINDIITSYFLFLKRKIFTKAQLMKTVVNYHRKSSTTYPITRRRLAWIWSIKLEVFNSYSEHRDFKRNSGGNNALEKCP